MQYSRVLKCCTDDPTKDLGHCGLAVNSDALRARSFAPDAKLENISGTNITEH